MPDVAIIHNLLWPRYKGAVFSALHAAAEARGRRIAFAHIAETDGERAALGTVDTRVHRYPYELLFRGAYDAQPAWRLALALVRHEGARGARLVVLPGYHRVEYWALLLACVVRGQRRAVFCDSTGRDRPAAGIGGALRGWLKRRFFAACDGFFAYGQRSAAYLRAHGAPAGRIFQPCQAAALPPGFDADAARARRLAECAPAPRFLYAGRLAPEKGLGGLLEAFARVAAGQPAARLAFAGAGPLEAALRAQARSLGIAAQVEWLGALDAAGLAPQFARATCLVLPSLSEPWGLVVNEALHHGCPVLVSEACGCRPELVVDGVTGLAHAPGDVAALAAALERAPAAFADVAAVAAACQRHMAAYTPERAAATILGGCEVLLAEAAR